MSYTTAFKPVPTTYEKQSCIAKRCMILIADAADYPPFIKQLVGKVRQAVEIIVDNKKIYLDNEDGSGWMRLIESQAPPTTELQAQKVICYLE